MPNAVSIANMPWPAVSGIERSENVRSEDTQVINAIIGAGSRQGRRRGGAQAKQKVVLLFEHRGYLWHGSGCSDPA